MSGWLYKGKEILSVDDLPEGKWMGFVYLITDNKNDKLYIGKKLFTFSKTKQVKLKVKKVRVESDWLSYYGSNDALKEQVAEHGEYHFTREILHLCETKGICNYLEVREQIDRRVLENDNYYNGQIQCRIHKSHLGKLRPKKT